MTEHVSENTSITTPNDTPNDVTVRLDDRLRLMSAVLAATDLPYKSQQLKPHGTHAHSRAARKYLSDHTEHSIVQLTQRMLDNGAPLEALFMLAMQLTPDFHVKDKLPAWVPPNWDAVLRDFHTKAELDKWWQKERVVWDKALREAQKVFAKVRIKPLLEPFFGTIAEDLVFIPNISYPTDRELGIRSDKTLICLAPPPMAWGDSPPWPYDEDTMLMHSYRAAIVQYGRILLISYLRANAKAVSEAAQTELPVNDQFRAAHPTWEDQFTELFITALVAMYLEEHVNQFEYRAFVLMEQKVRGMNILPGTVSVLRRFLQEQGNKYSTLVEFLPIFPKQLRVAKRIVTL